VRLRARGRAALAGAVRQAAKRAHRARRTACIAYVAPRTLS